ncbi:MAG: hypothetical protein IPI20_20500 [Rhodoferax sp.]|nr:hypothetical protein [Rhodoferax sp.]
MMKLLGDHGPELVIRDLVEAQADDGLDFNGVHFFCFGGFFYRPSNGSMQLTPENLP